MADHKIYLPPGFQYVYQFGEGSLYKCVASVLAMIGQIAFPGRWQSPAKLMSDIYEHYAGPDIPSNTNGMTKEQVLDWLNKEGIGHIDMQHLVGGDMEELRKEMTAQNLQNVCQLITIGDESKIRYAMNGKDVHAWADGGLHHCILRIGFSDSEGYGLYFEPAAGVAYPRPLPVKWSDIVEGGIMAAIAIMPYHVDVPPASFSYQTGAWPPPPIKVNVDEAVARINTVEQALQAAIAALNVAKGDLGKQ